MGDGALSTRATSPAALGGIRIVECGGGVAAAYAARVLADLGADVVKVERAGGDRTRTWGPFPGGAAHPDRSATFAYLNTSKRALELSGNDASDHARLDPLLASADVVITNADDPDRAAWQPVVTAAANAQPDLVALSLSAYGQAGPWAGAAGEEINVSAVSGISAILGEPGRTPLSFPGHLSALQTGWHGAAAVLTALLARRRGGPGQRIDVAEADVMAFYAGGMSLFILGGGGAWERRGFERHGSIYPSGFYPCKDGFVFFATQSRAPWRAFLRLMGDPEWSRDDPALQDGAAIGWERADEVDLHFIPWLAGHTRAELTALAATEPDIVLGPINGPAEVLGAAHLEERGFWYDTTLGDTAVRLPGYGYRLSATPWRATAPTTVTEQAPATAGSPGGRPATRTTGDARPLAGYRAIEFGWNWAGPMVGQILADMGMEIIKIETSARVDFMRHWTHARPFFHNANRGKLSAAINVKSDRGRDLLLRLAPHVDVVFDNFSAGVMERNGLGDAALRAANPRLITMSMAMAGQTGPLHHLRGFATMATGFAGLESAIGYPETGPTGLPAIGIGDTNAAVQGVVAILAALWHRERTGEGQHIDLSQIEAATALAGDLLMREQLCGPFPGPTANDHPSMAPHGIYPTAGEERWVSLAIPTNDAWATLVDLMGGPEWARDESLATAPERHRQRRTIDEQLSAWTRTVDRDELVTRLRAAAIPAAPLLEIDELHTWPQFTAREFCTDVPTFEGAPGRVYHTPWHLAATPRRIAGPSPKLGEHTDYVLREMLGLTPTEVDELTTAEVIV